MALESKKPASASLSRFFNGFEPSNVPRWLFDLLNYPERLNELTHIVGKTTSSIAKRTLGEERSTEIGAKVKEGALEGLGCLGGTLLFLLPPVYLGVLQLAKQAQLKQIHEEEVQAGLLEPSQILIQGRVLEDERSTTKEKEEALAVLQNQLLNPALFEFPTAHLSRLYACVALSKGVMYSPTAVTDTLQKVAMERILREGDQRGDPSSLVQLGVIAASYDSLLNLTKRGTDPDNRNAIHRLLDILEFYNAPKPVGTTPKIRPSLIASIVAGKTLTAISTSLPYPLIPTHGEKQIFGEEFVGLTSSRRRELTEASFFFSRVIPYIPLA